MMISTKGRYALRLILAIAQEGGGRPLSIREIAKRQEISEKYSEQIILQLSRAGLVTGQRGAQGGYTLSRPADQITAGEVLRAAEGSIAPVECAEIGCEHSEGCMTYGLWRRVKEAVDSVVDSTTVADLLADAGPRGR